ncbi:MAG: hypothetical protein OXI96_01155 [Acidimicrobiaceae bacterium]|nr:hypothetical protein [Acidimicrobiaceae bacterium]
MLATYEINETALRVDDSNHFFHGNRTPRDERKHRWNPPPQTLVNRKNHSVVL